MDLKKIEIGFDGIKIYNYQDHFFLQWVEIVGVNRFKGALYLNNGEEVKVEFFRLTKAHDFLENKIGIGEPIIHKKWENIFKVIKNYIKKRGNIYIEEFEGIYTSWFTIVPIYATSNLKLSKEEKFDKRIFFAMYLTFFLLLFTAFLIKMIIYKGQEITSDVVVIAMIILFVLFFIFGIIFLPFYRRKSKIFKILKRYGLSEKADSEDGD